MGVCWWVCACVSGNPRLMSFDIEINGGKRSPSRHFQGYMSIWLIIGLLPSSMGVGIAAVSNEMTCADYWWIDGVRKEGQMRREGSVPSCGFREVGRLNQGSLAPWLLGWLCGLLDSRCPVGSVGEWSVDGSVCGHVERMRSR